MRAGGDASPTGMAGPATLRAALSAAAALGLERLDAQRLLLHVIGRRPDERAWLLAHDSDALPGERAQTFAALCARHAAGEPVAYLLGETEFYGLRLAVDGRVLIPRADTETLVDWALQCLQGRAAPRVLDLGTGSGAIALALAHTRPDAHVDATDASAAALAVARANAQRLALRVRFAQTDWLAGAKADAGTGTGIGTGYDLIVSNPPYIAEGDPHLAALAHEPTAALTAGPDGLHDLRRIIADAPSHLRPGGWLLLEHGYDQSDAVSVLLRQAGLACVQSRKDLAGIQRCTGGCLRPVPSS